MAEPPGQIERTFRRAGQLQLHRLSERSRFHCVRCRRDKTNDHVAIINGDWTQTVCIGCYGLLVHEQREAKKAAHAARHPDRAKQPGKKDKAKQPEGKQQEFIAKREQQLQRQLPGVDRLLAFFRAAGVHMEVGRRGCLMINGSQTQPLRWILPSPKMLDWNDVIDEMAMKYAGAKFVKVVEDNACFGEGLRAYLRPHLRGFVITRGGARLAVIRASHAQIPRRDAIYANFLTPGPHWQQVADVLRGAEPELMAEWKHKQEATAAAAEAEAKLRRADEPRRIDHLPDALDPELLAACLDASRRIRLERQVAYERPVILEFQAGKLTLLPIAGTGTRLLLPFHLNKGAEALEGRLLLNEVDPLPLLIGADVADEDAITAWTCALLGFADATCIQIEPIEQTERRDRRRTRWPASTTPRRQSSTLIVPRKRPWPSHLEPVGHWVQYSGSFVAGHRRHLHHGQTASDEARDRARQVGIVLRPNETWVQPHVRGVPEDIEMRFLWHSPAELETLPRTGSLPG
jgi:hypothetical protein